MHYRSWETSEGQKRMEASFKVGQDPKGAVAPYMDACVEEWMDELLLISQKVDLI
jgi:hypothetical protein